MNPIHVKIEDLCRRFGWSPPLAAREIMLMLHHEAIGMELEQGQDFEAVITETGWGLIDLRGYPYYNGPGAAST